MDRIDPSLFVFFRRQDLKAGKKMLINFPHLDLSKSPKFLPREKADAIPFSSIELTNILQLFSFSQGSPQAEVMEDSLRHCEFKPIEGETKICATSLESMLDFVTSVLGLESQIEVLTTTHLTSKSKFHTLVQNHTVLAEPREISVTNLVACHRLSYPYAVFNCHGTEAKIRVFKNLLAGDEDGVKVYATSSKQIILYGFRRLLLDHLVFDSYAV